MRPPGRMNILTFTVRCPYCSLKHKHGAGTSEAPLSFPMTRSAHCCGRDYDIVTLPGSAEFRATPNLVASPPTLPYMTAGTRNQLGGV